MQEGRGEFSPGSREKKKQKRRNRGWTTRPFLTAEREEASKACLPRLLVRNYEVILIYEYLGEGTCGQFQKLEILAGTGLAAEMRRGETEMTTVRITGTGDEFLLG